MSNKFIFKLLKARFKIFLTKKRFIQSYKKKKAILTIVLLIINIHIWNGLIDDLKKTDFRESFTVEASVGDVVSMQVETATQDTHSGTGDDTLSPAPIADKICQTFPDNCETMVAIAKAESGLNPEAFHTNTDGSTDTGIFQINSCHGYDVEWLKDIDNNLKAAKEVYEKQGITAWSAYNNKSYLKHYENI